MGPGFSSCKHHVNMKKEINEYRRDYKEELLAVLHTQLFLSLSFSQRVELRPRMACPFSVVVAIDFGTTSSGYAFSFTQDSEAIHMMK